MAVKKCSREEAESYIKTLDPAVASRTQSISKPESAPTTEIIKVKPICSYYLKKYHEERTIPISIADKYCKEVILRNHVKGKDYTTLGFENNAGGYNLSAPYGFKSCSKGGITTIDTEGKRTVMPSTRGVAIFEGSFDFLSWQACTASTKILMKCSRTAEAIRLTRQIRKTRYKLWKTEIKTSQTSLSTLKDCVRISVKYAKAWTQPVKWYTPTRKSWNS